VGCSGGEALGAPLWVALLLVQSEGGWNRMECLVIESASSPLYVQPYPLYNEIGQVQDGLRVQVYGLHVSESRRVL
jgi:hypothetical protein